MPSEVFPPGEFIRDELTARNWTIEMMAGCAGCSVERIQDVIDLKPLNRVTAWHIGKAFGTSPQMWLRLEEQYRTAVACG